MNYTTKINFQKHLTKLIYILKIKLIINIEYGNCVLILNIREENVYKDS